MNPSAPDQPDPSQLAVDAVVPSGQSAGRQAGQQPAPGQAVSGGPGQNATTKKTKDNEKGTNPNSTQNSLQIAEVRDGIVIMNDGSFRSVVMVKSINFDLMSPQEQEAVEYSYQGFLNSLYFPIQIFLRSQKVDLQPLHREAG